MAGKPVRARLRRWYVPNAIYFITFVTQNRRRLFSNEDNVAMLRQTMRNAQHYHPFRMRAWAIMPEHIHLLIKLEEGTVIDRLMQSIQWNYTMNHKKEHGTSDSVSSWQRGYWDHVIRDPDDFSDHAAYIHFNPIKHGLVRSLHDYPHTSFADYIDRGWYHPHWCEDVTPHWEEGRHFEP